MRSEVAVVGAGPAGTAAAITLARQGVDVTVVDKARFPRDKCCGDGLTVSALRQLERLGLDPAEVPSWRPVSDTWLRSPTGRATAFPLPDRAGAFAVVARRQELDAALVRLARHVGVTVLEGHGLTGATQHAEGVALRLAPATGSDGGGVDHLDARFVIGADGMWSPLRRRLGLDAPGYRGEWHAFRQYARHVSPAAATDLWVSFEPDLLPGYFWSFPVGDGDANVGFGIVRGGRVTPHEMGARWIDLLGRPHIRELLGPDVELEGTRQAWPIPCRIDDVVLADGRALFVGDAAAAADPLTGEGIGQALHTGTWAAEAIVAGAPDALAVAGRYERSVQQGLVADHRFGRRLGAVLASPVGAAAVIRISATSDWTRRNFARWLFEDYPRATVLTPRRWGDLRAAGS